MKLITRKTSKTFSQNLFHLKINYVHIFTQEKDNQSDNCLKTKQLSTECLDRSNRKVRQFPNLDNKTRNESIAIRCSYAKIRSIPFSHIGSFFNVLSWKTNKANRKQTSSLNLRRITYLKMM